MKKYLNMSSFIDCWFLPSLGDVILVGCIGEANLEGCIGEAILEAVCMGNKGLWAWESKGEAVRLVSLESVCWKDEFPEDKEAESPVTRAGKKYRKYVYCLLCLVFQFSFILKSMCGKVIRLFNSRFLIFYIAEGNIYS